MGDKKMYCGICQKDTPHEYIGKQEYRDSKKKKVVPALELQSMWCN